MTREEVIRYLERHGFIADDVKDMCIEALNEVEQYRALGTVEEITNQKHNLSVAYKVIAEQQKLGNDTNVGSKLEKTERFNRMIEAFECDFALIEQGEKTFAELDKLMKDNRYSLAEHMDLMQELSYLIRHGKAEIWLKEGE